MLEELALTMLGLVREPRLAGAVAVAYVRTVKTASGG